MQGGRGRTEMTLSTLLLWRGRVYGSILSLSRFKSVSTCPLLPVKAFLGRPRWKVLGEGRVSWLSGTGPTSSLLARKGRRKWTMDQRGYIPQRRRKECEELVYEAVGLKWFSLIPLISGGQAFFFGLQDLLLQHFLELLKANTAKFSYSYVLTAPLCYVRSFQQREGQ